MSFVYFRSSIKLVKEKGTQLFIDSSKQLKLSVDPEVVDKLYRVDGDNLIPRYNILKDYLNENDENSIEILCKNKLLVAS